MSNYWAIAIGINQYQNFQPLLYAQWDAQALWNYWRREGGIPQNQCLLLTDSAAPDRTSAKLGHSLLPTKKTIEEQLVQWGHHRVGPEDTLWCFFSGYGLNHQGKDYLMPLDGDPNNIAQTGIAADAFFDTLSTFPSERLVVLLDLKRSTSGFAASSSDLLDGNVQAPDTRLGDDIAKQAEKTGIATILASQPDQLSHETLTLRQGLFTATILEGLQTHGCFQVGQLIQYLEQRLPELSEYHWRPRQEPMIIVPAPQRQQVLLDPVNRQSATVGVRSGNASNLVDPQQMDMDPSNPSPAVPSSATAVVPPLSSLDLSNQKTSKVSGLPFTPLAPSGSSGSSDQSPNQTTVQLPVLGKELSYKPQPTTTAVKTILPPNLNTSGPSPTPSPSDSPDPDPPETIPIDEPTKENETSFWAKYLPYCLPLLALMILVVLKLNWPAITKQDALTSTPDAGTSTPVPVPNPTHGDGVEKGGGDGAIAPPEISTPVPENSSGPSTGTNSGDAGSGGDTALGGNPDSSAEPDANSNAGADGNEGNGTDANASNPNTSNPNGTNDGDDSGLFPGLFGNNKPDGPAGNAIEQARAAMADGNYEDAATWLNQVPVEVQTEEYVQLRTEVDTALGQATQTNREILDRAIATLNEARLETRVNQASDFGRAIAIANQIQFGEPLYDEAQGYISRWGEVILDLAKSRAQSGQYEKAIATVSLIEEQDLPVLYPKAQTLLEDWQNVMGVDGSSQEIIDAAKVDIRRFPNQAFPYNRGIGKLREIEPDEPLYNEAQRLIGEWSQEILNIAKNRAQQGNIPLAIDTAKYVPQDTAAYQDAVAAIDKWSE